MTRSEYNELRHTQKFMREHPAGYGCQYTIPVNSSRDFKAKMNELYEANNLYPVSVRVDTHWFDDKLRIIYIYGANDTFTDCFGRTLVKKTHLRTYDEVARIQKALEA